MSDRKMTERHIEFILFLNERTDGTCYIHKTDEKTHAEILAVIKGLADGSLRCADTKTEVVANRKELEAMLYGGIRQFGSLCEAHGRSGHTSGRCETYRRLHDAEKDLLETMRRWLSTPDLPQK